jgi:hypothetical protein
MHTTRHAVDFLALQGGVDTGIPAEGLHHG